MKHGRYIGWILMAILAVPLASAADGDPERGEAVYQKSCVACHYADRTDKKQGPGLKGLFDKATLANGKQVSEENVLAVIDAGGNGMPPYRTLLSEVQKQHLLAYLKTL